MQSPKHTEQPVAISHVKARAVVAYPVLDLHIRCFATDLVPWLWDFRAVLELIADQGCPLLSGERHRPQRNPGRSRPLEMGAVTPLEAAAQADIVAKRTPFGIGDNEESVAPRLT